MKLKRLSDQVVVVFGASSGIGRLTALKCAAKGAKLVVSARGEEGLRSLKQEIENAGGECEFVVANAEDFDSVKAVADFAVERFGRLNTWIHAAGIYLIAPFEDTTPEEFKHVIDVNLIGQAYGAMAALPKLKASGAGALIHISSIEAKSAVPWQGAYAASKAGIVGFLDALRLELRKENAPVSVTNIMPSATNTPLFSSARTKIGVKPSAPDPVYEPEVVVDAILHAAEHPTREVYAGASGMLYAIGRANFPGLTDEFMLRTIFDQQMSDEPKARDEDNNFRRPVRDSRVHGDFGDKAKRTSPGTWLSLHPFVRNGLALSGFLFAAMLVKRTRHS